MNDGIGTCALCMLSIGNGEGEGKAAHRQDFEHLHTARGLSDTKQSVRYRYRYRSLRASCCGNSLALAVDRSNELITPNYENR